MVVRTLLIALIRGHDSEMSTSNGRRAKKFLTPTALRTLYFAFIQSHLNYCPIILSSISQHNFNQIKLIQKKAIRIITDSTYTAHTAPLFDQLQILPYELIIKQAKLLFMHFIEYNYAPPSWYLDQKLYYSRK